MEHIWRSSEACTQTPYSYVQGAPRIAFAACPGLERQSIEIRSKSGVLELVSSSPYPVQAVDW